MLVVHVKGTYYAGFTILAIICTEKLIVTEVDQRTDEHSYSLILVGYLQC